MSFVEKPSWVDDKGEKGETKISNDNSFSDSAWLGAITSEDSWKQVDKIGLPSCDWISYPELIKLMKEREAIKAEGYLSYLQQFWLDMEKLLWIECSGGYKTSENMVAVTDTVQ